MGKLRSASSTPDRKSKPSAAAPTFIDVFAGCGGLSLGLMQAGWTGLFAIERDKFAFETLAANLVVGEKKYKFRWPSWLPKEPTTVEDCLERHSAELSRLKGKVDLLVGGPPCQGFSTAGRRDPEDPRNKLMATYLRFVRTVEPKIALVENVRGFTMDFVSASGPDRRINYSERMISTLSDQYVVYSKMLDVSQFGVPQQRKRFFVIAVHRSLIAGVPRDPFELLEKYRPTFLREKGIPAKPSARSALSDLEAVRNGTRPSSDTPDFLEIKCGRPQTQYQKLMRNGVGTSVSDLRLARHRSDIALRFSKLIKLCHADGRLNVSLDVETRTSFGLRKQALRVLDPEMPAPTVTSMPDDLLHYSEPRTLTVRENARLQSFPDWFAFKGKYTSGGELRKQEVPRFTQVANAVPPLTAEAIGRCLLQML